MKTLISKSASPYNKTQQPKRERCLYKNRKVNIALHSTHHHNGYCKLQVENRGVTKGIQIRIGQRYR